jgi:hypothetical protein
VPVVLRYRGWLHPVLGITVTHAADGVARGYLTRAPAITFGTAQAGHLASDHRRGADFGTDGLFAASCR